MKIISINAGSSSLKFSLFNMENKELLISGYFERIGMEGSFVNFKLNGEKIKKDVELKNHEDAVKVLLDELINLGVINSLDEIDAVGHRLVHGGDVYNKSVVIDEDVIKTVDELSDLAPLHNPANLVGVKSFKAVLPNVPMVGVFDTAFHQTMDEEAYLYGVPYEWYTKYGVRKYGFHGTSHNYVTKKIAEYLNRDDLKIICCHLGNGSSISAVKDGKCIDTSMGFTPNAGLIMGTRCGDIDATLIPYVMNKSGKSLDEVINDLNKNSGLLGISGLSSDNRDIEDGMKEGNEKCILAQNMLIRKIVGYVSMYNTFLGGADIICFTGGIGENGIDVRKSIMDELKVIGVNPSNERNNVRGELTLITEDDSKIACYVVPTNEELMIAEDTYRLINK
ncbi:MAG: acetate kinase [Firmicutes bacterium]|nr:acetate kinase [Bacillota bacterium]